MKRWLMHGLEILLIVAIMALTVAAFMASNGEYYDDTERECNQP